MWLVLPLMAQLPSLGAPSRPLTTVLETKSGSNLVLSWTTAPAGTYDYYVYEGVMHPEYRAEVLLATYTDGTVTHTITNGLTETRQGYVVDEFFKVYAVAHTAPPPLAAQTTGTEHTHWIRNDTIDCALVVTNGDTVLSYPTAKTDGMVYRLSRTNNTKFDFDPYNMPIVPSPSFDIYVSPGEGSPATVVHTSYQGNIHDTVPVADNLYSVTTTVMPTPTVVRTGDDVDISWSAITYTFGGAVTAIRVIRTYLGVGDGEPFVLVDTLAPDATAAEDDISGVTNGWYIFYQIQLVWGDGTYSDMSASSLWILK